MKLSSDKYLQHDNLITKKFQFEKYLKLIFIKNSIKDINITAMEAETQAINKEKLIDTVEKYTDLIK